MGEHSGVNRVQPQLGSLQPGSLRFTVGPVLAYSAVKTAVVGDRPSANPEAAVSPRGPSLRCNFLPLHNDLKLYVLHVEYLSLFLSLFLVMEEGVYSLLV